ncbi:MAG: sigma-70 family RNA polymerase sigma factor [Clostridia bacterium]|nr:sigma-70 family RNA polymerase sigma factor [Clostridia bacterium]
MSEFEKLLQENLIPLERYVKFKINNKHDAEDIIQDVCLAATMKFDTLKNTSAFKAWLIGIANHKCNDYYRRKAKDMNISLEVLSESAISTGRLGITEHSVVRDTLDALGDKEKQILYLYFFKNMSQEDISKQL